MLANADVPVDDMVIPFPFCVRNVHWRRDEQGCLHPQPITVDSNIFNYKWIPIRGVYVPCLKNRQMTKDELDKTGSEGALLVAKARSTRSRIAAMSASILNAIPNDPQVPVMNMNRFNRQTFSMAPNQHLRP